jgi:hypothetical protein
MLTASSEAQSTQRKAGKTEALRAIGRSNSRADSGIIFCSSSADS